MTRALSEIYTDIQKLSDSEKRDLIRALVAELDAPADHEVEKAWLRGGSKTIPGARGGEGQRSTGTSRL
jgi:hypothetical protein